MPTPSSRTHTPRTARTLSGSSTHRPAQLFEALERKQLLAGSRSIIDVDGDNFSVTVIGAGDIAMINSAGIDIGLIESLTVSNTDKNSRLNVSLTAQGGSGDGRINLRGLSVTNPIRQIDMPLVDMLGDGDAAIEDVLQLIFGNVASGPTQWDIASIPVLTGQRTALFGNVGTGGTFNFTPRFKTATFGDFEGASLNFAGGVDKLRSNGDLRTTLSGGAPGAGITEIDVVNALRASGIITGDVKSIKAGSVENAGGNFLDIGGSLGSVKWGSTFDGRIRANYFGTFTGADYAGQLEYRGFDAKGLSFKSFKLTGDYDGGGITNAFGEIPGYISTFAAGSVSGGFIQADGIGSFKVTGDLLNTDINLDGILNAPALKTFFVGGQASGNLNVHGDAGSIKFGHATTVNPFHISDGMTHSFIKSISLTNKFLDSRVQVDVGSLGSFDAAGGLVDSDFVFNPIAGAVTKKFIAGGTINSTTFNAPSTYGFNLIQALGMLDCVVSAGYINALTLGFGATGGSRNTDFTLSGLSAQGYGLRTAKFGETFDESYLNVVGDGKAGALTSRQYLDSNIWAGTIDSILATGHPQAVLGGTSIWAINNPASGFSIKSIDLRGYAANSNIGAAGSIDKIKIVCIHTYGDEFRVSAGLAMTPTDLPVDLAGFALGASINSIDITKAFDPSEFDYNRAFFVAPSIGKINVNGKINLTGLNDGGQPYGFGAATFGQIKLKDSLGGGLTLIDPPLGANNPFPSEALSNFRIVRYQQF